MIKKKYFSFNFFKCRNSFGKHIIGEIKMRHQPDGLGSKCNRFYILLCKFFYKRIAVQFFIKCKDDNVGFNGKHTFYVRHPLQCFPDCCCTLVVFLQPCNVMVECINAGGSQVSGLPHSTSKPFTDSPGPCNKFFAAQKRRAHRRSKPFGETHRYGIEQSSCIFWLVACYGKRIKDSSAIKMSF